MDLPKKKVKTVAEFLAMPPEFQQAIRKIVISHAVNELYGAQVFDEPAIALAPDPYSKWLTCRVAMEEYGHHVRFRDLGIQLEIPIESMSPASKKPLSIFEFPLETWPEFCVIKLLADLGEILQVEDLLHCSFEPLQKLARITMPEEQFHADFGKTFCADLCKDPNRKEEVQEAINRYFPMLPAFFGRTDSRNNAIYRKWGIKRRRNEEMRDDYLSQAKEIVSNLGLELPTIETSNLW